PVTGGTFTDRGNGRGDLVINPATAAVGTTLQVLFTATDSLGRSKSVPTTILIAAAADILQAQVVWTPPTGNGASPTGAAAIAPFLTQTVRIPTGSAPAGLVGYAVYRGTAPGLQAQLASLVGVSPASANTFTDTLPKPPEGQLASFRYFYVVTALYQDG